MYDVSKNYFIEYFESLSSSELFEMMTMAKKVSFKVGSRERKKVLSDITCMRNILRGFNSNHNEGSQC